MSFLTVSSGFFKKSRYHLRLFTPVESVINATIGFVTTALPMMKELFFRLALLILIVVCST